MGSHYYQINVSADCKPIFEQIAYQSGYIWGGRGNVRAYLEDFALNKVQPLLREAANQLEPWSESRQQILLKLIWMLRDAGNYTAVQELAAILLERPELNEPIRAQLERYKLDILPDWKSKIQILIENQTSFVLSYADAQGEVAIYNVRYATIVPRERHQYLDAWTEGVDNARDLPELAHNRSFRFDRITSAGVAPLTGDWRTQGLDTVEVEFKLMGRLAHAYEPRTGDVSDRWTSDADVPTRVIKRNITSTFWFVREMLPYGKDCVVVAPKPVRDRLIDELKAALDNY